MRGGVLRCLDYGAGAHYLVLSVGGRELPVRADAPCEGHVDFSVDLSRVTYFDDDLDVLLL